MEADMDSSGALVPLSNHRESPVYPLQHSLELSVAPRLSICWARGNSLRVSIFSPPSEDVSSEVVEVKLSGGGDSEISDVQWRRIAYSSVSPFAMLQS